MSPGLQIFEVFFLHTCHHPVVLQVLSHLHMVWVGLEESACCSNSLVQHVDLQRNMRIQALIYRQRIASCSSVFFFFLWFIQSFYGTIVFEGHIKSNLLWICWFVFFVKDSNKILYFSCQYRKNPNKVDQYRVFFFFVHWKVKSRHNCLEGSNSNHYSTNSCTTGTQDNLKIDPLTGHL